MAKRPTVASLKKVTPENLAALGAERLAEILADAAQARPELKRRLRMELAAEHGADHLGPEIDRRLTRLETSKGRVSWRQRPTFVRDLEGLRGLIAERLAELDREGALARLWRLLGLARRLRLRVKDKDGQLGEVFERAAGDVGRLSRADEAPDGLVEAMAAAPADWITWLPALLAEAPDGLADAALRRLSARAGATAAWLPLIRALADAAGDASAYGATFTEAALKTPSVAAEVAQRLLAAGEVEAAGRLLSAAGPGKGKTPRWLPGKTAAEPDFEWESAWIDWLEASGQGPAAQEARWAAFERTLSAERARAFTRRLPDFEDVEAEHRAFALAAGHADFARGLALLMDWPALPEAARMIEARADDIEVDDVSAQAWAAKLRQRYPAAAHTLLRRAAAAAFRRRDFATCDRLTSEAEAIGVS